MQPTETTSSPASPETTAGSACTAGGRTFRNVVLYGMMGAGKSVVGRLVAADLGMELVDIDAEIVRADGRPIVRIFHVDGEACFRRLEMDAVARTADGGGLVIATGGGAPMRVENRRALAATGMVFYLAAHPETLMARLRGDTTRPLLQKPDPRAELQRLLGARESSYRDSDAIIQTDDLTPAQVAAAVCEAWRQRRSAAAEDES